MPEELLTVESPSLDRYVSATPTKYFFIAMLVKDITLEDAVIDLVDNSVDAAHKVFGGHLNAAEINIVMSNTLFTIQDNCGGMSLKTAQEEAFRIGREEVDLHDYDQSIGQFGVGLKRAIFKFGAEGTVTSRTVADCFEVEVNRDEWLKDHVWGFPFHSIEADSTKPDGVLVNVGQLNTRVAEDFGNDAVIDDLKVKIRRAHYDALSRGIRISVNDQPLEPIDLSQYEFEGIRSISKEIQSKKADGVKIFIQAGISGRDPRKAGWNVMCGNRMVLSADQSSVTG